jgi:photosystem II stability/assembly factor-like uncharacterized protein
MKLAAVAYGGAVYTSTNWGVNWASNSLPEFWTCIASSADGNKLVATAGAHAICTSADSGGTWVAEFPHFDAVAPPMPPYPSWLSVCSSADGTRLAAITRGVYWGKTGYDVPIFLSPDSGRTWGQTKERWYWSFGTIACSADGSKLGVLANDGYIYASTNGGVEWTSALPNPPLIMAGASIAVSADGNRWVVAAEGGGIYTRQTTPHPEVTITSFGNSLVLSWIIPSMPFVVEQSFDLNGAWAAIQPAPRVNYTNLQYEVSVPRLAGAFYRLVSL